MLTLFMDVIVNFKKRKRTRGKVEETSHANKKLMKF